ncbi:hypothetical protein GCM10027589_05820 [Actinocorallia lasiicapitis]
MSDAAGWTDRRKVSFLAHALVELLDVVPTERSRYLLGETAEQQEERAERARRICGLMDAVQETRE